MEYRRGRERRRIFGPGTAWLVPLVLLAGIVTVDFQTAEQFRVVSWIILVPSIAAAICGVGATITFALLSLVTYLAVDTAFPERYRAGTADFVLVALGGALAVIASVVRVRRERQGLHMRDIAETTRRTVLRPLPPNWAGLEHAGVYLAADMDARVGGDFYDIQPSPNGTRVLLGDVQGKGLGAVETAAALLGTFREAAYHESDLATVADRLEVRMCRHRGHTAALGRYDGDRFATALLLGFPKDDRNAVEVINFGHEPPLAVGPRGVRPLPGGERLPIGFGDLTGETAPDDGPGPPACRERLDEDETLLMVTDGVTEARDRADVFYPLLDDVARAVAADPGRATPRRLVRLVREGVLRHTRGRLDDDTTVFALRRLPAPQSEPRPASTTGRPSPS
ncbi:PP2C family protein-serine/threonine phosphatase [Streptomyces sp. SID2999]|uniref:PP2C family protein-serine/threonine phosphatase n=1 Tax=Streptomyces sp. SID2999 TaxID=2690258 RepID=UPI001F4721D0|nr:PP2C family protein-serine/threonine phosphatase [Streptomyces sp. SID2999]